MISSNINNYKKVHFIGIGGINMSSLANILLYRGISVSGSDSKESDLTRELAEAGAVIFIGQNRSNIADDLDLVVYTAAIKDDNPELTRARELGIETQTRAEFLGNLMKEYESVICVSGTHGKTTTTSMISQIFIEAKTDPTIMNGGIMPLLGSQTRIGSSGALIAEACEYTNSFLSFFPTTAIILNVKADHLDFFKDIDNIRHSFREFARLLPEHGTLILNDAVENPEYFTDGLERKVVTFGLNEGSDFCAKNISYDEFARGEYDVYENGNCLGRVRLNVTGEHGITNSLAAFAAARNYGIEPDIIIRALKNFEGVNRRFEIKGTLNGVTIIDDYAHHPDEINATLSVALKIPHKKLWIVFQPHTYSRTLALMDDFASALSRSDAVVLTDIYAAREKNTSGISSDDLRKKIESIGTECYYCPTLDDAEKFLLKNCKSGDVLITMGAGDVVNIGENLLKK